jgi:hypothetical protein
LFETWDFTDPARRLFKTRGKAEESCEKHKRLWTKACEATGVRALKELFGKLPLGLPMWARKKMDRRLYAILIDNRPGKYRSSDEDDEPCTESSQLASDAPGPGGPTRTSDCSVSPTDVLSETAIPASPAEGKAGSTPRRTRRARSKAASTSDASTVPPAEAAGIARKKPAAKRTAKSSKRTATRKMGTTGSSTSGVRRSRNSRKTKSALLGS